MVSGSEAVFSLERKQKSNKTTPSSVSGSWMVSRLRQLITISELSTELCLSCGRDIIAEEGADYVWKKVIQPRGAFKNQKPKYTPQAIVVPAVDASG
jgi:hypothetical protein